MDVGKEAVAFAILTIAVVAGLALFYYFGLDQQIVAAKSK